MCGIVGYIGHENANNILIEGLKRLEYRGYDSAGIATMENNGIHCIKNKGRVKNLEKNSEINKLHGTFGIAHTRWATHGKPCIENSHPHMDNEKRIAVVHNGIIENYNELREMLKENGYNFISETDTEVIPNLINYFYKKEKTNTENAFLKAVHNACNKLKGSYALGIITQYLPEQIIVTRKDSPIVIGKAEKGNYVSSDIPAILSYTKKIYFLEDKEYAILTTNEISFYNDSLEKIEKQPKHIEWETTSAEKGNYEDFMLKEIFEQPKTVEKTIKDNEKALFDNTFITREYLNGINKIYIIACGTAMHAGLVGRNIIENLCKIPTEVDIASEFRYRDPLIDEKTLAIYISQSGETADTIAALKLAKRKGAKTLAMTNVIGSSITREADTSIYTCAGPEIAVASTKAYTSQITLLSIVAIQFAEILGRTKVNELEQLKQEIKQLPEKIEDILEDINAYKRIAKELYREKSMFFIGRGVDYNVAMEGSLKLKEISYIHSESYAAGELKHGPIALIEKDTPVIAIATCETLIEKTISNIQEVISRGAKSILITSEQIEHENIDTILIIPKTDERISPILSVVPLQLISYYIAKEKNLDVDKPRNLAKSVTVE